MQQFTFQYTVIKIEASLDDRILKVKQGIRTFEIPVHTIRMLFAGPMPPGGDFQELILVAEINPGKPKKFRFYSNDGEEGFKALIEELVRRYPAIDLRSLARKEALLKMKAADTTKIALIAVPFIIMAVMGTLFSPMLIHGLDRGSRTISAQEIAAGKTPETRNLLITGQALNRGMEEKTTRKGTTTVRLFFPLVEEDWQKGRPIYIIVETPEVSDEELSDILSRSEFKGVLRNVLWEGPTTSQREFFKNSYDYQIADSAVLLDLTGDASQDLNIFLLIMGISAVIIIGVTIFMMKKMT